MAPVERILLATDFSDCARPARDCAAMLATALHARLDVLYVSEVPSVLAGDALILGERFVDADVVRGRAELERTLGELRARGVDAEGQVRVGFIPDVILEQATPEHHDLVVLGTHGRRGFQRMWMGSVAERVVRACAIPVLTVGAAPGS